MICHFVCEENVKVVLQIILMIQGTFYKCVRGTFYLFIVALNTLEKAFNNLTLCHLHIQDSYLEKNIAILFT